MVKRKCDYCGKEYEADTRNLKRGWGLCCNKRCAAKKREKAKPTWDAKTVARNNYKRENGCFEEDEDKNVEEHDGSWDAHECNCLPIKDYEYLGY